MYHVFICYPRTYLDQVSPVHDGLENALRNIYLRDAQVFQDKADLAAGAQWETTVNTAMKQARIMIVVVVPTILDSPECRREMIEFIDTPGKFIVPLICEPVPNMKELAAGLDQHQPGSEAYDIAKCAAALRKWEAFDFTEVVYDNPDDSDYKRAIARLARMVRDTLSSADEGDTPPRAEPTAPTPKPAPPQAAPASPQVDPPKRNWLKIAIPVLALAAIVGGALFLRPGPDPVPEMTQTEAQMHLDRAMETIAGRDHIDFDSSTGALRIIAPIDGSVQIDVALQALLEPILQAGFTPGFKDVVTNGEACIVFNGNPLMLQSTEIRNGDTVLVRPVVQRAEAPKRNKTCVKPRSAWVSLASGSLVMKKGAIWDSPNDAANQVGTLRLGQELHGRFSISDQAPGWIRYEDRHRKITYLKRSDLLRLP